MLDCCPTCAQAINIDTIALGDTLVSLSDNARDHLDAILFAMPRVVSAYEIFDYVHDDADGGSSESSMRKALNIALAELNEKLLGSPLRIVRKSRPRGWTIELRTVLRAEAA